MEVVSIANKEVPVVMTVAGSDSSAGAGIQADLKSIAANGGYGLNAVTSVVSEVPGNVSMVHLVPDEVIRDQIRVLNEGFPLAAIKTGMLGGRAQVLCVVDELRGVLAAGVPLVVDPVMVATGGGRLLAEDAIEAVVHGLIPLAKVITPNMDEAEVLWGKPVISEEDMVRCGNDLAQRFNVAVLVKGGHLPGEAADFLVHSSGTRWFRSPRVNGVHTHGTGCSCSAAIATWLARGSDLESAVDSAKRWLSSAIADHLSWHKNGSNVHALNHLAQ